MENNNNAFNYTYSAKQQERVKSIRQKYVMPDDKMQLLERLDANVYKKATMYSLIVGLIGTLGLGIGMSCCMVLTKALFLPGLIVGIIGIIFVCLAYPVYITSLSREREKIAPEILRISDEIMNRK